MYLLRRSPWSAGRANAISVNATPIHTHISLSPPDSPGSPFQAGARLLKHLALEARGLCPCAAADLQWAEASPAGAVQRQAPWDAHRQPQHCTEAARLCWDTTALSPGSTRVAPPHSSTSPSTSHITSEQTCGQSCFHPTDKPLLPSLCSGARRHRVNNRGWWPPDSIVATRRSHWCCWFSCGAGPRPAGQRGPSEEV